MLRIALPLRSGSPPSRWPARRSAPSPQDKKDEKKTARRDAHLHQVRPERNKACGHALIVKEGDKKVKYYLVDKGGKEPYHKDCCTADVKAPR